MKRQFCLNDGSMIQRESRWIKIRSEYVTKRHSLWDYADRYNEQEKECVLHYFVKSKIKYALGQFMRFDSPLFFYDNKKRIELSGYDCTCYYKNYLIEINSTGEAVRLYTLVPND